MTGRVLSLSEALKMSRAELANARRSGFHPPIAGGDGDDDGAGAGGDGSGSGEGDGDGDGEPSGSGDGDGDGEPSGSGDGDGDGSGSEDDEEKGRLKAERDRAKQAAADADKARKKAERELESRKKKDREGQGEYEKLYKDAQGEVERLKKDGRTRELKREVVAEASRQGFKNPELALTIVIDRFEDDVVDEDGDVDTSAVESELKKLAKSEAYLVEQKRPQGGDLGGDRSRDGEGKKRNKGSRENGGGAIPDDMNPDDMLRRAYEPAKS